MPIIYLLLLKDLFLTGLRFRNRYSQWGQPTLLAICCWNFLVASLHSLGQRFSTFCGLLIFLSHCVQSSVTGCVEWCDAESWLVWSFVAYLLQGFSDKTLAHTILERPKSFQVMLALLDPSCWGTVLIVQKYPSLSFYSSQADSP